MSYTQIGIPEEVVHRVKLKLKNPQIKERVKMILHGVTKSDLQDRTKIKRLLIMGAKAVGETLTAKQQETIIAFVISQKIDPKNTFHLIKLWSMFR
jgi:hypothetical protein